MAHVYVRSGAVGTGTGASWANAYTTLAAALTAKAAGDNFWVSDDHAETQASTMTLTSPGTVSNPCTIFCVNHSGTVPPVSADFRTTATISTTGASDIRRSGYAVVDGITFSFGGGGFNSALWYFNNPGFWTLKNSKIICASTRGDDGAAICTGGDPSAVFNSDSGQRWINTTVKFGDPGQGICHFGTTPVLEWFATVSAIDTGGSVPSSLFFSDGHRSSRALVRMDGVDLSGLSTNTLTTPGAGETSRYDIISCKLPASFAVGGNPSQISGRISIINCDSGATNYRNENWLYQGSQVQETTIVRTGGATDGTTPISTKIVTTANSTWLNPYVSLPLNSPWNDTTGANVTVTVYGIWGGGAVPNNDDIWIEVSYMGSSATPIATINTANTKADYLATNAGQTSDSSTWGGSTTKFKMVATLSSPQPGMKGPMRVIVKAAAASSTFYIDPKVVLS